mgnify:CR=1 FL=1
MKSKVYYLLLLLFLIIGIRLMLNIESFTQHPNSFYGDVANVDSTVKGLYPTRKLGRVCNERGSKPAYMPTQCIHKDGTTNRNANCECMDKTMTYCTSCYPDVKHEKLTAEEINNEFPYMQY